MRVSEWMSPDPVTVTPTTTVLEARRLLRYYGVRHLPVVEGGRVVGVISDRDVHLDEEQLERLRQVTELGSVLGAGTLVEDVMSSPAQTIGAHEDINAAARLMLSRRINALPVVSADGTLMGVITTTDCLLASLAPEPAG
jgi:acetoin utilization protein AcuB